MVPEILIPPFQTSLQLYSSWHSDSYLQTREGVGLVEFNGTFFCRGGKKKVYFMRACSAFILLKGRRNRGVNLCYRAAEMLKAVRHLLKITNSVQKRRTEKKVKSIIPHRHVLSQPNPPCWPHMHMFPFCQHIPGAFSQH